MRIKNRLYNALLICVVPSEAHSPILGVVLGLRMIPESLPYNRISLSNLSNQSMLELCLGFEAQIWFFRDWDRAQEEEKWMFFLSSTQQWFYTSSNTSPTAHLKTSHKGDEIGVINCVRAEERDTTPGIISQMFWPLVPYSIYATPPHLCNVDMGT